MKKIIPFADEQTSLALGNLTIENRLDRIEVYGEIQITKDNQGLRQAIELKEIVDAVVASLQNQNLPPQIAPPVVSRVKNPFE